MAVSVFADPLGIMQQGRNVDSEINYRNTQTALGLVELQHMADQNAMEKEYLRRTAQPPAPPNTPQAAQQNAQQTKAGSDMIYGQIGQLDKNIAVASSLGYQAKLDQLYKQRDALMSRYSLAQQREESTRKRVQDQQKENIATVGRFATSAADILSGDAPVDDKVQQLQELDQAAKEENPDAYKVLSGGTGKIDWADPRTFNRMKALAQEAIPPEKRAELKLKAAEDQRKADKEKMDERKADALIAAMRERGESRDKPRLPSGMQWGDKDKTFMVPIPQKASASAADTQTTDSADEAAAWDYLIRGHSPPARGGAYNRAMAKVGEIAKENKMTVPELVAASADVKTKLAAKRNFEVRTQNLQRAENQLELEIPVMQDSMKKLDLPSIPIAARGNLWALRQMGNPDVTKLDQAAETVFNEFNGIITGNPGTLNVQDVANARHQYEQAQTPQQMQAAIDGMKRIITNAKAANDKTRKEIMGSILDEVNPKAKKSDSGDLDWHNLEIPK